MYVFFSISMPTDNLPQFIYKLQCQVIPNRANGFCFLHAVCLTVCMDHDEEMTLDKLQSSILDHMAANGNYYKQFHTGNVLKDMKRYFKFGTYCNSIVDLIVVAMARALNMNLKIYQKGTSGNIQILEYISNATAKEIHLKFTHDPSNVARNHYYCILLLEEPTLRHTDEEVTIESPCPSTIKWPICLDDADVIDLTDDSEMTTSKQPESPHNNTSDELQFPMHLLINTEAECVDELPHDIDGFKLYKINCSPHKWVQKNQDLWYFKMNTSRRKDLIGTKKVGRCLGSQYHMSANCPFKHSAEGQSNTVNFQNVSSHKVCFSCGSIASRKWCGTCKMTEYCMESGTLTVYHVDVHKCHLKKDTKIYKMQVREAVMQNRGLGAPGIQQVKVGQAVANSDIREAQRRAMQVSYGKCKVQEG